MDGRLYLDINRLTRDTPWAHGVLGAYSLWGGLVLLAAMLVGGWLWARTRPDAPYRCALALLTGIAAVVVLVLNQQVISPAFARPRPYLAYPHALVLLAKSPDYSFPSDHAIIAGAFAAGLLFRSRPLGTIAAVAAVILAFARVYTGMHYPTDTIAGLLIGAAITTALILLLRRPTTTLADATTAGPLRPLVSDRASGDDTDLRAGEGPGTRHAADHAAGRPLTEPGAAGGGARHPDGTR